MPVTADLPPSRHGGWAGLAGARMLSLASVGGKVRTTTATADLKVRTTTGVVQAFRPAVRATEAPSDEIRVGFARPGGGYIVTALPLATYVARRLAREA